MTSKMGRWVGVALVLGLVAACGDSSAPKIGTSKQGLIYSPYADQMAIYASNSVEIDDGSTVIGPVGVYSQADVTAGTVLADDVRLMTGVWSSVGYSGGADVFASTATFHFGTNLHTAYTTKVYLDLHGQGSVLQNQSVSMKPFPRARPVTPGTGLYAVAASSTVTLTPATHADVVDVGNGAVVHLGAGSYEFGDLMLGDTAALIADGTVEVRVLRRIQIGARARLFATSNVARDLRIEALGKNGLLGLPTDTPRAIDIGAGSRVRGTLLAPNGTIKLGAASTSTGAFVAHDVWIGSQARVAYSQGLAPLPGSAPLAHADLFVGTEDQVLTVPAEGVMANDLDPTYDPITATLVTHARNGTVSLQSSGAFTYTPNAQFEGLDHFTYRVSDGTNNSNVATASIAVDGVNDVPNITSEPPTTAFVGQRWRYLPTVVDPDIGDSKTFTLVAAPSGVSIDSSSGLVSWTPTSGQVGSQSFSVRITDSHGASDTQSIHVTVSATPALESFTIYADNSLDFQAGNIDGKVGVRSPAASGWLNSNAPVYIEANAVVGKAPGSDLYGTPVVLLSGSILQDIYTNNLAYDQSASRGSVIPLPSMPTFPAAASASPGSGTLTVPGYSSATLSPSTSYNTWSIGGYGCLYLQAGTHHVQTVNISDVGCIAALGPVDVRVGGRFTAGNYTYVGPAAGANLAPSDLRFEILGTNGASGLWGRPFPFTSGTRSSMVGVFIARNGTLELGGTSFNWGRFLARDIHAMGEVLLDQPLTDDRPPSISSSPSTTIPERSTYTYAVTATDPDVDDTLSFSLLNGPAGMTISATTGFVRWPSTVVGVYSVGIGVTDDSGAIDTQSFPLTVTDINDPPVIGSSPGTSGAVGQAYSYQVQATDPESDALSYSLSGSPSGMTISGTGLVSWTPAEPQAGTNSVTVHVIDARGASTSQSYSITVTTPNHAPVFSQSPSTQAVATEVYTSSTRAIDQDPADTVHYELIESPPGLTLDGASGNLRWTPLTSQIGPATLSIRAVDSHGAAVTQTTQMTVRAKNLPPTFSSTPPTTATEGEAYTYQATATDTDSGDSLSFSLETGPAGMSVSSGGAVSWTPAHEQVGSFGVTIAVTDSANHIVTQSYQVAVTNVNQAPEITSSPTTHATEGGAYSYLIEASDPDADDTLTYALTSGPTGMSLSGHTLSWTPTHAQAGTQGVSVSVTDQAGASASQSFSVTVTPLNTPPYFATSPNLFATQHQPYTYAASALDADPGNAVSYQLDVAPTGMSVGASTGVVTWTPSGSQIGPYNVILRASDPAGALDIQSFTIDVADGNDPPYFVSAPVSAVEENQIYTYAARAADPDRNAVLTYALITGPSGMTVAPTTGDVRWATSAQDRGSHSVLLRVGDNAGSTADQSFMVTVSNGAAACTGTETSARCSALGFAYALGRDSVPLGGVLVDETDPSSAQHQRSSDLRSGALALGTGLAGEYEWLFHASGFVPVFRRAELVDNRVSFTAVPRLTPLNDAITTVDTGGGTVADVQGLVSLSFAAGAVTGPREIRLAVLDSQSLPGFVPRGYSPASGLWYEADGAIQAPPTVTLRLPAPLGASPTLVLGRWDATQAAWVMARSASSANPTAFEPTVTVALDGPGGYVLLLADPSPNAPPTPTAGAVLVGTAAPAFDLASLEAHGRVEPETQVASVVAADVTGDGRVWIRGDTTPPSGLVLPARVYEIYSFADAPPSEVPSIDLSVALYRYPPLPEATSGSLSAHFLVRPRQLLDGADVRQRIELLTNSTFDGLPIDSAGGTVGRDGISLTIPSGAFTSPALIRLARISDPALVLDGAPAVHAFSLEWANDGLAAAQPFALDVGAVTPNTEFVLARRFVSDRGAGFTPVQRFASDVGGVLTSVEPTSGAHLPGITTGGTYALFPVPAREGVIVGTVRDPGGAPLSGVLLEVSGRPWRALTTESGTFALLGLPGTVEVVATRPPTTDTGRASGTLTSASSSLTLTVEVGPIAPFVVAVRPADNATEVPVVSAIDVTFSEPIRAADLASPTVLTLSDPGGAVPGHVSTRPDRRSATFLPDRPLNPAAVHTLTVAGVHDDAGDTLSGQAAFHFTTSPARPIARASARLISYAPGSANNPCIPYDPGAVDPDFDPTGLFIGAPGFDAGDHQLTCVIGNVGTAEPGRPVSIVNEDSGGTATTIARSNGSFKAYIRADEADLLSAAFTRVDGTTLVVPLELQHFDDGRVGVFASGGVISSPNPFGGDPFELIVEPGSIARRGVFKFETRNAAAAQAAIGVAPLDGTVIGGGSVRYSGDPLTAPVDVRLPMAVGDLQLPSGVTPEDAGFVLATGKHVLSAGVDVTAYETVDRMRYEAGALATHSFPMVGLLGALAVGFTAEAQLNFAMLAMARRPTVFSGHVIACVPDAGSGGSGSVPDVCVRPGTALQYSAGHVTDALSRETARARPLEAAVVLASAAADSSAQHQLRSGALVALTDQSGRFALAIQLAQPSDPALLAVHPDFAAPAGARLAAAVHLGFPNGADFVFSEQPRNEAPVRVSVTHSPAIPDPWDGQIATTPINHPDVVVTAVGSSEVPSLGTLRVAEANGLGASAVAANDIVLTLGAANIDAISKTAVQHFTATAPHPARVVLEAEATESGIATRIRHVVYFGASAPTGSDTTADPNDTSLLQVLSYDPPQGSASVPLDQPIRITFTKPLNQAILSHPSDLLLTRPSGGPGPAPAPNLSLRNNDTELLITFPDLQPGTPYELRIQGPHLADRRGRPFDQDPSTPASDDAVYRFTTEEHARSSLPGLVRGGGAAILGGYAYVLDRASGGASLLVYELASGNASLSPTLVNSVSLPGGYPRSLQLIQDYSYVRPGPGANLPANAPPIPPCDQGEEIWQRNFPRQAAVHEGCVAFHRNLLAIIGGTTGSNAKQYLSVLDITDPRGEVDSRAIFKVAQANITLSPESSVGSLKWSAPSLGFVEYSGTQARIHMVTLQAFIFGNYLSDAPSDWYLIPPGGNPPSAQDALDADNDGSFVGPDDILPFPARQLGASFYGDDRTVYVSDTNQAIRDYFLDGPSRTVGAALSGGQLLPLSPANPPAPPSYRTLSKDTLYNSNLPRARADLDFHGANVDAVYGLPRAQISIQELPNTPPPPPVQRDLVLVTTSQAGAVTATATEVRAFTVDITDPLNPIVVGSPDGFLLPTHTPVRNIQPDPLDPTRLSLFSLNDKIVIDSSAIGLYPAGVNAHPSILGVESGIGGRTDLGLSAANLTIDSTLESDQLVFRGPTFEFVTFPAEPSLVDPVALSQDLPTARTTFHRHRTIAALPLTRVRTARAGAGPGVEVPSTVGVLAKNVHVLVRVPGAQGPTIALFAECTNISGAALSVGTPGLAPTRAMAASTSGALFPNLDPLAPPIPPFVAYRLSSDKASDLYNVYLSDPIVFVAEEMSQQDIEALPKVGGRTRIVMNSADHLRVSVDPETPASSILGLYKTGLAGTSLIQGKSNKSDGFDNRRALGPNPAPLVGAPKVPGTHGLVNAHNQELELHEADIGLPSPAMPLTFVRSYRGQDKTEGQLGPGWDFNYNQRFVEVKHENQHDGRIMFVVRGDPSKDTAAAPDDVILHDGAGNLVLFRLKTKGSPPSEYLQDALLTELVGAAGATGTVLYYLPPPGVFDALVRFGERGTFLRLTPKGVQYKYDATGRLTDILGTFPSNHHQVVYDEAGFVQTIQDVSVPGRTRKLELGYYRASDSIGYRGSFDVPIPNAGHYRRLALVRDSAGRDVRYEYDLTGHLTLVRGVKVPEAVTPTGGGSTDPEHRKRTEYGWQNGCIASISGVAVDQGQSKLTVSTNIHGRISGAGGTGGPVIFQGGAATAAQLANSTTTYTTADQALTAITWSEDGLPTGVTYSRSGEISETYANQVEDDLLSAQVTLPRGNIEHAEYDPQNATLRSRGNLRRVSRLAGGAGSGPLAPVVTELSYDEKYNILKSVVDPHGQTDFVPDTDLRVVEEVHYPGGLLERRRHDAHGRLTVHDLPDGTTESFDFDASTGYLQAAHRGPLVTSYAYSGCAFGDELGLPCTITDPIGKVSSYVYTALGSVAHASAPDLSADVSYDDDGRVAASTSHINNRDRVESFTYAPSGFLSEHQIGSVEGPAGPSTRKWTFTPDVMNRVQEAHADDGRRVTTAYDKRGRVANVTAGTGSEVEAVSYHRDENGNLTSETSGVDTVIRQYDGFDRLWKETTRGATAECTYHSTGDVLDCALKDATYGVLTQFGQAAPSDVLGRAGGWTSDGVASSATYGGLITTVTGPRGVQHVSTLDTAGRLERQSSTGGAGAAFAVERVFDETTRTLRVDRFEGTSQRQFTTTSLHDVHGNITRVEDNTHAGLIGRDVRADGALLGETLAPDSPTLGVTTSYQASLLGEPLSRTLPSGARLVVDYDEARRVAAIGRASSVTGEHPGPGQARHYTYNAAQQVATIEEPDGRTWGFLGYDARGNPQQVTFPGQSDTALQYDDWGRVKARSVTRGSYALNDTFDYDALDRVRVATRATSTVRTTYDLLGTPSAITLETQGLSFTSGSSPYEDGTPNLITYPSVVVEDERDGLGRLVRKTARGATSAVIFESATYATAEAFQSIQLGNGVTRTDTYDARKRLTSRKYSTGTAGTRSLVDLRYAYDDANRELGHQAMQKGGRLDVYAYDSSNRLTSAEVDARPAVGGETGNVSSTGITGTLRATHYGRDYDYGSQDALQSVTTRVVTSSPEFLQSSSIIDGTGHLDQITIAGSLYAQSRDELGNTTHLRLPTGAADLEYDALSQLRRVARADGSVIAFDYRADGVLLSRTVTCTSGAVNCEPGTTIFVYAGMLLLEEYALVQGQPELRVRYHYEDSDVPVAVDVVAPSTTVPERLWLETDRMGSVIGVLDGAANEVERIEYDPYGRPTFLPADLDPPVVSSITRTAAGDWLIAFTEEVLPPPTSGASSTTIDATLQDLSGAITATNHGTGASISGTLSLSDAEAGFDHGTVLRFQPTVAVATGTQVDLHLTAGALMDRFTNRLSAATLALTLAAGVVYSGPAQGSTAVQPTPRSTSGVDLLFQSHLFDPNTGLILARARVLDPGTGNFLQRDPSGFRDSVNLYAAMANNPVCYRDPTGAAIPLAYLAYAGLAAIALTWDGHQNADLSAPLIAMGGAGVGGAVATRVGGSAARQLLSGLAADGAFSGVASTAVGDMKSGQLSSAGTYVRNGMLGAALGAGLGAAGLGAVGLYQGAARRLSLDINLSGALDGVAREMSGTMPSQFPPPFRLKHGLRPDEVGLGTVSSYVRGNQVFVHASESPETFFHGRYNPKTDELFTEMVSTAEEFRRLGVSDAMHSRALWEVEAGLGRVRSVGGEAAVTNLRALEGGRLGGSASPMMETPFALSWRKLGFSNFTHEWNAELESWIMRGRR